MDDKHTISHYFVESNTGTSSQILYCKYCGYVAWVVGLTNNDERQKNLPKTCIVTTENDITTKTV